jgi:hypothetical protein
VREVLRTATISLAESLRLALEGEDIPAITSNENLGGLPPGAISVAVLDDEDFDRAVAVLHELQRPRPHIARESPSSVRVLIIVIVGVLLVFCASLF